MTGDEQRNAMQQAIDTLSMCRVRIMYNHMDETWLETPITERSELIDSAITGLMCLIANLEEPDL